MPASDAQVQQFVNERVRVRSEQIRSLLLAMEDDRAVIGDVYDALSAQSPTWTDNRTDGPPHLLTPANVLAWNTFLYDTVTAMRAHASLPAVLNACVRPVGV